MNLAAILRQHPLTGTIDDLSSELAQNAGAPGTPINYLEANKIITDLHQVDHHDEAYLVTNARTGEITWSQGVEKWLGYKDVIPGKPLPHDHLSRHIPESVRTWSRVFVNAAILVMQEEEVEYLATRFVINAPLRRSNQRLILTRHMVMPFHFDSKKRIVSLIHSISICGDARDWEPLQPSVFNGAKEEGRIYEKIVQKVAGACDPIDNSLNLTKLHFELLGVIAELRKTANKINVENITALLDVDRKEKEKEKRKEETIRRYLDRMKERLWTLTGEVRNDKDALDTILPLERSGFTDVLKVLRDH